MSLPHTPQLLRSAPYFPVADVELSAAHYERVFGFHREYVGGAPPQFAILSRDGLSIMLRLVPTPERISPNEKQGGTWDAFFWVRDARALHAELQARGAEIVYGPIVQDAYQMRNSRCATAKGTCWGSDNRWRRPVDLPAEEAVNKCLSTPNCQLPTPKSLGIGGWRLGVDGFLHRL